MRTFPVFGKRAPKSLVDGSRLGSQFVTTCFCAVKTLTSFSCNAARVSRLRLSRIQLPPDARQNGKNRVLFKRSRRLPFILKTAMQCLESLYIFPWKQNGFREATVLHCAGTSKMFICQLLIPCGSELHTVNLFRSFAWTRHCEQQ